MKTTPNALTRTHRDGSVTTFGLVELTDKELADRMAKWYRINLRSFRRDEERHGSMTYRWLVLVDSDGTETRLTAAKMSRYFVYSARRDDRQKYFAPLGWTQDGVQFFEDPTATNWWLFADVFCI